MSSKKTYQSPSIGGRPAALDETAECLFSDYRSVGRPPAKSEDHWSIAALLRALLAVSTISWLPTVSGECSASSQAAVAAQLKFACSINNGYLSVDATYSSKAVTVITAGPNVIGNCSMFIGGTALTGASELVSRPQEQKVSPSLLFLKMDNIFCEPYRRFCANPRNSFSVYLQNTSQDAGNMCKISTQYMWVSNPVELRMSIGSLSTYSTSFDLTYLLVASPINICQIDNGLAEVRIDSESYVFASDSRYHLIPPNGFPCSENVSYQIIFTISISLHSLNVAVLSKPESSSCWSLLLGKQRCNDSDTVSVVSGTSLYYLHDGGINGMAACIDSSQSSFVLRIAQSPGSSLGSGFNPSVSAAAAAKVAGNEPPSALQLLAGATACSAVGAVAAAAALTVGITVITMYRRRLRRDQLSFAVSAQWQVHYGEQIKNPDACEPTAEAYYSYSRTVSTSSEYENQGLTLPDEPLPGTASSLPIESPEVLYSQLSPTVIDSHDYDAV